MKYNNDLSTAPLRFYLVFLFCTVPLEEAPPCFVSRACTLCTFYQEFRPMRMKNCAPPPHPSPNASPTFPSYSRVTRNFPLLNRTYVIFPSFQSVYKLYEWSSIAHSESRYKWRQSGRYIMCQIVPRIKTTKPKYLQTNNKFLYKYSCIFMIYVGEKNLLQKSLPLSQAHGCV